MNKFTSVGLAAALCLVAIGARAEAVARRYVSGWPEANRKAALAMIEKYGEPQEFVPNALKWNNRGPFKQIVVFASPRLLGGMVQQTVSYRIPADAIGMLSLEGCNVIPDKDANDLTSCGSSEERNTLCLNVADEVLRGKRDVAQARAFQSRTIGLQAAGKSSDYLKKILFPVEH